MAFGSFGHTPNKTPMAEINMVPLIDVMLVLLVIFILLATASVQGIKVDLPKASSAASLSTARRCSPTWRLR